MLDHESEANPRHNNQRYNKRKGNMNDTETIQEKKKKRMVKINKRDTYYQNIDNPNVDCGSSLGANYA